MTPTSAAAAGDRPRPYHPAMAAPLVSPVEAADAATPPASEATEEVLVEEELLVEEISIDGMCGVY